eukprot:6198472-Pleurochrysis_carterae.AAC.4
MAISLTYKLSDVANGCCSSFASEEFLGTISSEGEVSALASAPSIRAARRFWRGAGSAVLLLEEFEHAVARGAPAPLAELVSVGNASDGHHPTAPSPDGRAALRAMRSALSQADISVDCIDYINAHATST